MRIILIGNYLPDKQESMIRFAGLLEEGFQRAGFQAEIWTPTVLFGSKAKVTNAGAGKWLAYVDKYIIFPLVLKLRLANKKINNSNSRFHICDHSNAPYLKYFPADRTSITCHDVIAITDGLGYTKSTQPVSKLGKFLQRWILNNLQKAKSIAFVSQLTFNQFKTLLPENVLMKSSWQVIHNSFNADFHPMDLVEAKNILNKLNIDISMPFLLHVGSDLPRKNRKMLLDMMKVLESQVAINLCLAGESLNKELVAYAASLELQNKVIQIVKPDHTTLLALYRLCSAFVFPSLSEGFGWPVIEAQACGVPVIASNIAPMPEVSGGAALHFDPMKPNEFAKGFLALQDKSLREELVQKGFENGLRFSQDKMINAYLRLFNYNA